MPGGDWIYGLVSICGVMDNLAKLIAENVKRLRKAQGLKQTDLALTSGVSYAAIQDIEQGKRHPRQETLEAIAGALQVPTIELISQNHTNVATDPQNSTTALLELNKRISDLGSQINHLSGLDASQLLLARLLPNLSPAIVHKLLKLAYDELKLNLASSTNNRPKRR